MNCEKCRYYKTTYCTYTNGVWTITARCLLGGCNGSQYEPKDGAKMDERSIDDEVADLPMEAYYNKDWEPSERYCDRNLCHTNEVNGIGCDECPVMMDEVEE